MIWILLFIVVWTVASVAYFIHHLGSKNKPGPKKFSARWFAEAFFYPPVIALAITIGWLGSLGRK